MKLKFVGLLSLLACFPALRAGDSARKYSLLPVPTFGYSPETRGYIGAVCQLGFRSAPDTLTRMSQAKLEVQYTQNGQFISEIGGTIFTPGEKWLIIPLLHFSYFPDYWWGIGNESGERAKTRFISRRNRMELAALKSIKRHWFAGPTLRLQRYRNVEFVLPQGVIFSRIESLSASAFGAQLLHDSRNSILNPESGAYLDVQAAYNRAGDRLNAVRISADYRRYHAVNPKLTVAGRACLHSISGSTVFYDLALFGGDRYMRGYYYGRFRDRQMWLLSAEARYTVYRRWGLAMFGGGGSVSEKLWQLPGSRIHPAWGAGIRFLADRKERINLRIDYARGSQGQSGFYFAFGEAF